MTDARAAALRALLAVLAPTLVDIEFARLAGADRGTRRLHEQLDIADDGERLRQITHSLIEADNYR